MRWLSVLATGMVWLLVTGCGPSETGSAAPCTDPAFGELDESCGVWASASLGDDANPGTRDQPKASLSAAMEAARQAGQPVYACGETWSEPLLWRTDISLYGGFDCQNGWVYRGEGFHATVKTGPGEIPFKTTGVGGLIVLADIDVYAADAVAPGGSSIAVMISDPLRIHFRRCKIVAGNGADGLDGDALEDPAPAGAAGLAGADACTTMDGPGGAAAETECAQGDGTRGGKGGDGGAMSALNGEAGQPAPPGDKDPANPQDGDGGTGQIGVVACSAGEPGASGAKGASGVADKNDRGFLSPDGYMGADGPEGEPGTPGQGGGGGGGSRGGAAACGAPLPGGAGGGSGGAGGCGGKGGKGGQAGGSSFALAIMGSAQPTLERCELWVGKGGKGGRGAKGQPGGPGGEAGQGGAGKGAAQAGCQGGVGGAGGNGGGGAGGHGGHAVHFAYSGATKIDVYPDTSFLGDALGGLGGSGGDADLSAIGGDGESSDLANRFVFMGFQQ